MLIKHYNNLVNTEISSVMFELLILKEIQETVGEEFLGEASLKFPGCSFFILHLSSVNKTNLSW